MNIVGTPIIMQKTKNQNCFPIEELRLKTDKSKFSDEIEYRLKIPKITSKK